MSNEGQHPKSETRDERSYKYQPSELYNFHFRYTLTNFMHYCSFSWHLVNGGFSDWTAWGPCSAVCDFGQKRRSRTCTNPSPQYGGEECYGRKRQIMDCIVANCSGSSLFSEFARFLSFDVSKDNMLRRVVYSSLHLSH